MLFDNGEYHDFPLQVLRSFKSFYLYALLGNYDHRTGISQANKVLFHLCRDIRIDFEFRYARRKVSDYDAGGQT